MSTSFSDYGMILPRILLPKEKDIKTWSVVACDQYTQDPEYWKKAAETAGEKPSTLNLILPEVYLGAPDRKERIEKIRTSMKEYMAGGVFDPEEEQFMYIERTSAFGRTRCGLVCAIDLDSYDWKPFSKNLVRATEATIVDRIPPRKEIRKNAPLELPHIMLLANDSTRLIVEKAGQLAKKNAPVYSGEMMMNGGSIKGWSLKDSSDLNVLKDSLGEYKKLNTESDGSVFMFAVGDGNHSLATAKAVWDEYRAELEKSGASKEEIENSSVRYALVEIVNIYDEGLTFEPIHRVLFNVDAEKLVAFCAEKLGAQVEDVACPRCMEKAVKSSHADFAFVYQKNGKEEHKVLHTQIKELLVSRLQPVLDEFISANAGVEIDYIHGTEELLRLSRKEGAASIMLPPVAKDSFFETIGKGGPLPRKSFSMGEADEKRFYLECRRLFD